MNAEDECEFKFETGAGVNVMNMATYQKVTNKPPLSETTEKLKSASGLILLAGEFKAKIIYKGSNHAYRRYSCCRKEIKQ